MPERIQRRRTKGWRMPEGAVYVGRPGQWGNPFKVGQQAVTPYYVDPGWVQLDVAPGMVIYPFNEPGWREQHPPRAIRCETAEQAVQWFKATLTPSRRQDVRRELAGKDLACWCPLDQPCHADVLLRIANPKGTS